jgi:hypothetical protein
LFLTLVPPLSISNAASAVVTLRNKVGDAESSSFGGVIFARADNKNIQTVSDVNNRIVIASSVYDMGSGPMQWEEMRAAGEDLLFAPSQVSILMSVPEESDQSNALIRITRAPCLREAPFLRGTSSHRAA